MLKTKVPMKNFLMLEEINDSATFLYATWASFITGSVMVVDGRQTTSLL
jgi:enoyl-[acyl-carrier-protein] reductase (NADH)